MIKITYWCLVLQAHKVHQSEQRLDHCTNSSTESLASVVLQYAIIIIKTVIISLPQYQHAIGLLKCTHLVNYNAHLLHITHVLKN